MQKPLQMSKLNMIKYDHALLAFKKIDCTLKSTYRSGCSLEASESVSLECLMRYMSRPAAVMLAGLWPGVSAGDAPNPCSWHYTAICIWLSVPAQGL